MLDENPLIIDWSLEQWNNLYNLLFHRKYSKSAIIILHKDNKAIKVIHTEQGLRADLKEQFTGIESLKKIYKSEKVQIYAIELPVIRKIFAEFQNTINFEENYAMQLFTFKDALVKELGNGIHVYPDTLHWLKELKYEVVKKLFNILPDNALFVLTVFKENDIWTNWIIGIENGKINLITTLDALTPSIVTNWRKEYHHLINIIEKKFNLKPIAFFMDHATFKGLINSKKKLRYFINAILKKQIISKALPLTLLKKLL